MAFRYEGKNPPLGLYTELGSIGRFEDVDWKAFYRLGQNRIVIILSAQGSARTKANYRNLVWDGSRVVTSRDEELLRVHRNTMYLALLKYLQENVPVDSELLTALPGRKREGVTPEAAEWDRIGEVVCDALNEWGVYRKKTEGEGWALIKMAAVHPVPCKANYYLKWNGVRLAGDKQSDLLAEHRPELYDELVKLLKQLEVVKEPEPEEEQRIHYINLGPVGVVAKSERDLLVVEDLSNPDVVEVWLSTNIPNTVTAISFQAVQTDNRLSFEGLLHNNLRSGYSAVWAQVEELLKQYFLEKSFN